MAADRMAAERLALGSLATDPLVRLQMAGINPDVRNQVREIFSSELYSTGDVPRSLPTLTLTFTCTQTPLPPPCCWPSPRASLVTITHLTPLGQYINHSGLPGYRPPGPFDLGAGIRPPPGADYLARLMQHPSGLPGAPPPPPHVS